MTAIRAMMVFAVACMLVHGSALGASADDRVWPREVWVEKEPADVGLDAGTLKEFSRYVGGFGCVVRRGYLVFGWGRVDRRGDVASCCKPWFTHLLFTAIETGKVKSVDDCVASIEPRLAVLNADLGHKDGWITWRHLANQVSCYGVREQPGEAYDYSDYNMALFFDTLLYGVYGSTSERTTADVLGPLLTEVLQCQDNPRFDARGRLAISPRDFCRFGLLYLRQGEWNGRQLLSREHVRAIVGSPLPNSIPRTAAEKTEMIADQRSLGGGSNQTDHLGSYSWAWWTNGVDRDGRRHWPSAPPDTFAALGHAGKRALVVVPSLELIVAWNDSRIDGRETEDQALRLLINSASRTDHGK